MKISVEFGLAETVIGYPVNETLNYILYRNKQYERDVLVNFFESLGTNKEKLTEDVSNYLISVIEYFENQGFSTTDKILITTDISKLRLFKEEIIPRANNKYFGQKKYEVSVCSSELCIQAYLLFKGFYKKNEPVFVLNADGKSGGLSLYQGYNHLIDYSSYKCNSKTKDDIFFDLSDSIREIFVRGDITEKGDIYVETSVQETILKYLCDNQLDIISKTEIIKDNPDFDYEFHIEHRTNNGKSNIPVKLSRLVKFISEYQNKVISPLIRECFNGLKHFPEGKLSKDIFLLVNGLHVTFSPFREFIHEIIKDVTKAEAINPGIGNIPEKERIEHQGAKLILNITPENISPVKNAIGVNLYSILRRGKFTKEFITIIPGNTPLYDAMFPKYLKRHIWRDPFTQKLSAEILLNEGNDLSQSIKLLDEEEETLFPPDSNIFSVAISVDEERNLYLHSRGDNKSETVKRLKNKLQ